MILLTSHNTIVFYNLCILKQFLYLRTHIGLVFEGVCASGSSAVEVRGPLAGEDAVRSSTALSGPEPLETFLKNCRVLSVVVSVHLHVRC